MTGVSTNTTALTFKSVLVGLAPVEANQAAASYALSLGSQLGSHVTGCSYALSPDVPDTAAFAWVRDEIAGRYNKTAMGQAAAAVDKFATEAKKFKVTTTTEILRANLSRALTAFGQEARLHDVTCVTQSQRGIDHAGDLFAEAALFRSGRPFFLIPRNHTAGFSANRILIAWDGSQHAARAVAQAAPILHLAKKVEVLVAGSKEKVERFGAPKIVENLERHGMDVDLTCRDSADDVETILRETKVSGASILVMGGYGHSRAREIFFGGVTRYMMSEAPLPILMAH
jgi:nucleotide-binding universal stress UspA family protein